MSGLDRLTKAASDHAKVKQQRGTAAKQSGSFIEASSQALAKARETLSQAAAAINVNCPDLARWSDVLDNSTALDLITSGNEQVMVTQLDGGGLEVTCGKLVFTARTAAELKQLDVWLSECFDELAKRLEGHNAAHRQP